MRGIMPAHGDPMAIHGGGTRLPPTSALAAGQATRGSSRSSCRSRSAQSSQVCAHGARHYEGLDFYRRTTECLTMRQDNHESGGVGQRTATRAVLDELATSPM